MVADMPADKKSTPPEPKAPVEPPAPAKIAATTARECPLETEEKLEKSNTAAKHTYDVGYKKWESFDEEGELRKVDNQRAAPKKHAVDVEALKKKMESDHALDFDDPLKALDQAISQIQKNDAPVTNENAASETPLTAEASVAADSESIASTSAPEEKRAWVKIPVQEECDDEEDAPDVRAEQTVASSGSLSTRNTESPKKIGEASALSTPPDTLTNRYKKWENFDADAASDTEETPTSRPKPAVAKGFLNAKPKPSRPSPAPAETRQSATPPRPESSPDPVPLVAGSHVGSTTAASLNQEYQRWDQCDDMDEVSDEDGFGGGDMDLDALTGPKDEVRKIQKHWKREAAASQRAAREKSRQSIEKARAESSPALPTAAQIHRPCIYRAESDPEGTAAKAIRRDYDKWKSFDADGALLGLDNEGKTEEGNAMRCEARKGSAVVSAEGYAKDREEYELDEDIEKQMGSLKKVIAQRLKDATACKTEGNSLLRDRRAKEACGAYQRGLDTMELCQQACVIMADTMADKNLRLVGDLHRNLAAAQLEAEDWEGALSSCDAALKLSADRTSDHGNTGVGADDDKALYRRALALLRLDRQQEARKDIECLATRLGEADPAVRKLRAENAKHP